MALTEVKVINALCKNKDIHAVLAEDNELFGAFGDIVEDVRSYYYKYKTVPELSLLQERFDYLDEIDTNAPTNYYVEELRTEYVKSRMENLLETAGRKITADGKAAPQILSELQTRLAKLNKFTTNVRDIDITDSEWAKEHLDKLRKQTEENGGTPGIATGFVSIDSAYPTGLAGGHSVVCMGYTGRAKSLFVDKLAVNFHKQGYKPMIISLEMSPEEQMQRIYAMMGEGLFKISDLSRGDVSMDDFDSFASKKLSKASPFVVVSNEGITNVTPNVIQGKIDTHRPDVVILDYLQLMSDNGNTGMMTPRMLNLSREIKMLAVSNNIPIISITAVTDEDGDKRDSPPVLSQVAWSKGIEYDANLVIAIHKHDDTNLIEVVARKSRHGDLFSFFIEADINSGIWTEKFDL